ncbi:WD-repeat protein [Sarcoptes scabiei]|nr:WD-repeat protein [Sarcoptes scabiei]
MDADQCVENEPQSSLDQQTYEAEMFEQSEEDLPEQEIKSIEINLNVIKHFFFNTIALYEHLINNVCRHCNVIESEEFVNLHRNLLEFENIFNVFDVSFNKTLLTNLIKKTRENEHGSGHGNENDADQLIQYLQPKIRCFVNSCMQVYSSEEGAKIHFIKNHCKKGDVFEVMDDVDSNHSSNIEIKPDPEGRFHCQHEGCSYFSTDRSNFKVHLKRHINNRNFICVCSKKFFTRDPLMIHFVRVHMKEVDWSLANTDIRKLRKTIRRLINREYQHATSNDEIPDSDSDLNGPVDEERNELNEYITDAIANPSKKQKTEMDSDKYDKNLEDEDSLETPKNSFNVALNLKDSFFTDSVTFKSEGVEEPVEDLINIPTDKSSIRNMALSKTRDKVITKEIPQRHRKYKCPHKFCRQDFFTTKNLLIHLKASHDPSNPIPCTEPGCSARFKSTALLAQHQKRHQVQYSCTLCPYKTHLAALMTRHNRQHAGDQLHHECSVCHQKFEYLGALRTHLEKVHNEKEPLKCEWPDCDRRFKTIIGLKKHCREYHCKMRSEIACEWPDCDAVFSNKSSMNNHMRIHTNERPYQCDWHDCGKWFRLKETLKRHIKLHQGYRPHICPFDNCDQSFFNKRSLKAHIEKGHHLTNSLKNE